MPSTCAVHVWVAFCHPRRARAARDKSAPHAHHPPPPPRADTNDLCFFATGVGARYIQDYVYAVNRTTKAVQWKHTLPNGIYIDNLAYDYTSERLFSVAFNPNAPGGVDARVVEYASLTGNVTILSDISRELRGGFVYGGAFSICPTAKTMYVGIDAADGEFDDHLLVLDYALGRPIPIGEKPLLFPIPSTLRAFCTGIALDGIFATTIQSDSEDRETLLLGDINVANREGLFFPQVKGDLPTYTNRGEVPLFLNGLYAEHAGTVLVPVYAPFTPFTPIPYGGLWTLSFATRPPTQVLTPIDYYLAGAAGIPA